MQVVGAWSPYSHDYECKPTDSFPPVPPPPGSIAIAPLVRSYPTRTVLSAAAIGFGLMTTILLIVDAATGGKIRQPGGPVTYGNWPADLIFPIWGVAGIFYGMIELIRRVM